MKWTEIPPGQVNAAQQRLMVGLGNDASSFIDRINRDPTFVTRVKNAVSLWEERDGIIYCSVTSYGRTGRQWLESLRSKGFDIAQCYERVFEWSGFLSTVGTNYKVAISKGTTLSESDRMDIAATFSDAKLLQRGWTRACPELVCLLHEKFSVEPSEVTGIQWLTGTLTGFSLALSTQVSRSDSEPCYMIEPYRDGNERHVFKSSCGFAFEIQ